MPETKILPPDDLRRILKRAASREVTWPEIDLVKDHCAAMEERVKALEAAVPRCGCGATSSTRGDPECGFYDAYDALDVGGT